MRIVLVGAVESTRVALEALAKAGRPPVAVFTLPADRSSRHSDFVDLSGPAAAAGVPIETAVRTNDPSTVARLRDRQPDYVWVVGWSQICGPEFLSIAARGNLGYHPALLPENRGRAVIPWTILQRRETTGSTIFWLANGIDDGPILVQESFDVSPDETASSLYGKHMECLRRLVPMALPLLDSPAPPRRAQDETKATWCAKRTSADGIVDWSGPADDVWTLIRAVGDPYPGAFTWSCGRRLTLWEADLEGDAPFHGLPGQVQVLREGGALVQCGDGRHVWLRTVQIEGGPRQKAAEALRVHERLGIDWGTLWERSRKEGTT